MKTKFKVYVIEEMESSYIVEAESIAEAESKMMQGDYDESTKEIEDIYNSRIVDLDEVVDDE
jgi:hypothetical protein